MKLLPQIALFAALTSLSYGASYSTNFEDAIYPASEGDFNGIDGWTVKNPATGLADSTPGLAFTYIPSSSTNKFGGIGGFNDIPANASVSVSHPFGDTLGVTNFNLSVLIADSTDTNPNRSNFGIILQNGTTNLFKINFTPAVAAPTSPNADNDAVWNLSYSVGAGPTVSLTQAFVENGLYGISLAFSAAGTSTDFTLGTSSGGSSQSRTGTIAVDPSTMVSDFGFSWTPADPATAGDNFLLFDNIGIVPEPTSALLFCLGGALGLVRRKRA